MTYEESVPWHIYFSFLHLAKAGSWKTLQIDSQSIDRNFLCVIYLANVFWEDIRELSEIRQLNQSA